MWAEATAAATPEDVGRWVMVLFAVVGGALALVYYSRQIWVSFSRKEEEKPHDEQPVTRAELREEIDELKAILGGFVSRHEYDGLDKRITILNEYIHQRTHDLLSAMNAISLKIDVVSQVQQREIGRREGAARIITDPKEQP